MLYLSFYLILLINQSILLIKHRNTNLELKYTILYFITVLFYFILYNKINNKANKKNYIVFSLIRLVMIASLVYVIIINIIRIF